MFGGGIDPVICIVVSDGVFGCYVVCGWDGEWEVSETVADMSGDCLEDFGGLGFTKKAGGEVVEVGSPGDNDIRSHGWVEGDLVESCCHVCFGEEDVWWEEICEGMEFFIGSGIVLGGEVGVSGVNE